MRKPHPVDEYDRALAAQATSWTTFVQIGPFDRRRSDHTSESDAIAMALHWAPKLAKSVLVYGVTPTGRQVMIGFANDQGEFTRVVAPGGLVDPAPEIPTNASVQTTKARRRGQGMNTQTTTYSSRSNAVKAAKIALAREGNQTPLSDVHFKVEPNETGFRWYRINVESGDVEKPTSLVDLAQAVETGEKVTIIPPAAAKGVKAPAKAASRLKAAKLVKLFDIEGNEVEIDGSLPASAAERKGLYPSKARARDAKRARDAVEKKTARAAAKASGAASAGGKRKAIEEAAAQGVMPTAPDFSADTHKRYRGDLAKVVELAAKGDVKGLRAFPIKVTWATSKALDRYRNLCVVALEAKSKKS